MNTVELYEEMCSRCQNSTYCNEDCTECEEFTERLNNMVNVPPEDGEGW